MKAIIPVAGAGTKLRPLTYTQPKALIPMAGKTILSVIVDQLRDAGVDDFVFVVGYLGDKIQRYISHTYPGMKATFVHQTERLGTGHAIYLTKEDVGSEEVLIVFGDTIADYSVKELLASGASQIGIRKVDDPRAFGVAELNADDRVTRVVEKPLIPRSNMAMVGIYYIRETAALYEALSEDLGAQHQDGTEYHLTATLQRMIDGGLVFQGFRVSNWFDCGKKETLLTTNATLLRQQADDHELPEAKELARRFENTVVIPPVSIAEGCTIRHSIIGPNVTIGEHTSITDAIVKHSIIGAYAELREVVLHSSIIGSDAFVRGLSQSLNIGDNTEIDLG